MKTIKKLFIIMVWFIALTLYTALLSSTASAQNQYLDKSGLLIFEATEKLCKEVKATNKTATAMYNEASNQIAVLGLINFKIKKS